MSVNNNIWEIAEAYLSGTLPQDQVTELKSRLETDAAFANEFYEASNLIRSFEGSGKQKRFRIMLRDIHEKQAEGTKTKVAKRIQLIPQIWRTAAVAASVAILTSALTFWSLYPSIRKSDSQYNTISRAVEHIKNVQAQQQAQQNQLKQIINNKNAKPASEVKYTGTGFALNNDGYFVTAYHVINDGKGEADSIYIQNQDGQYFKANKVAFSAADDIAILKVDKKNFHFGKGEVPYTFANTKAGLGSEIFTLGYPKEELMYSEGYISGKNGYEGDNMQYTLVLPAGHGQSGSPVVDDKGNILGLLTAIGSQEEANTYAVCSKSIIELIHSKMPDDSNIRLPKVNRMGKISREELAAKMEAYTVSVKVYKK